MADWLTAAGDEVRGGRYCGPDGWLMPADGRPTGERVIAWTGGTTLRLGNPLTADTTVEGASGAR